jgi:ABC-type nickel/cobalt efflux system permease component RcnA
VVARTAGNGDALLLVTAALVAVVGRVLLLALVDATAWPVEGQVNYILPATDYLVLFVLLGCWSLARVALGHRRQNAQADAADETDGADEAHRADRGAPVSPAAGAP